MNRVIVTMNDDDFCAVIDCAVVSGSIDDVLSQARSAGSSGVVINLLHAVMDTLSAATTEHPRVAILTF